MSDIIAEITIAILALVGTLCGSIMASQKTTWRIDQLERKVEKHNNTIERVFLLEHDQAKQEEMIDELRKEIGRLANGTD